MALKDKRVAYYYDEEIGNYNYGGGNPMRPHRVRLTHSLVENYDLNKRLRVERPQTKNSSEVIQFHADDYIDFLSKVTPDNQEEYARQMRLFNLGPLGEADCPVFDGLFEYCLTYSNGSVGGATLLNSGTTDVCLNWAGGMHHAKKAEASGFCYVNDIVLSILELLKIHQRVLYVDIDIHHGDGVEEAFYLTDRVMTVSFHKYGDFFPGTGAVGDVGVGAGQNYSVNVPLQEGMDDESYKFMFEPIMQKVMDVYQPGAIVVCGGADSLSGDRLGCFNLSLQGHSNCVEFLAKFNVPMLVLGGGGYTMRNVARCWCYETGRMLGLDLPDTLPNGALREFDYYADTRKLRITVSNMKNANSREQLEAIKVTVLKNLSRLDAAPGAAIAPVPPSHPEAEKPEEEMEERGGGKAFDDRRTIKEEGYGSDGEEKSAKRHQSRAVSPRHPAAEAKVKLPVKMEALASNASRTSGTAPAASNAHRRDENWLQQEFGGRNIKHEDGPPGIAKVDSSDGQEGPAAAPPPTANGTGPASGALPPGFGPNHRGATERAQAAGPSEHPREPEQRQRFPAGSQTASTSSAAAPAAGSASHPASSSHPHPSQAAEQSAMGAAGRRSMMHPPGRAPEALNSSGGSQKSLQQQQQTQQQTSQQQQQQRIRLGPAPDPKMPPLGRPDGHGGYIILASDNAPYNSENPPVDPKMPGLGPPMPSSSGRYSSQGPSSSYSGPSNPPGRQMSGGPMPGLGPPGTQGLGHPMQRGMGTLGPRPMAPGPLGNGPHFGIPAPPPGFQGSKPSPAVIEYMRANNLANSLPLGNRGYPPPGQGRPPALGPRQPPGLGPPGPQQPNPRPPPHM